MFTSSPLSNRHAPIWWSLVVALLAPALFGGAFAQSTENVTILQLRDELAKRDAVIVDLLNRVRALEGDRPGISSSAGTTQDIAPADGSDAATLSGTPADESRSSGDFEIDELAAERALERSLVQEGARLLNPGQIEFTPGFTFSRYESDFPTALTLGNDSFVGEVKRTIDVDETRADLRIGLPFNSQLEVGVPYRVVDRNFTTTVDGAVQSTSDQSGSGFGDSQIGLAAALAAEESWRPNVIGRLAWLTGSGAEVDNGVSLGGGSSGLATRLSADWRRDPIVFLMNGGYTHYFEDSDIQQGDNFDVSLGAALAVSPETAFIFSLDQTFASAFKRNGTKLRGTDRLSSIFNLSTSTIIGRGLFLRVNAGVGLTEDAPAYGFGVSLPFRFDAR